MRTRARGAGLLIAVLLIVTVAAFAVIVGASRSGGDIQGNDALADSIEALYLAESGVERALKRYASGAAACGALGEPPITDLNQLGLGAVSGRTITILDGLTTDFSNLALVSSQTQCRVRVTARINASNVSRTIHAIVDRNLLQGANNHNFNNPSIAALPSGWVLAPLGTYAENRGPDGALPCNRAAMVWKPAGGGGAGQRTVASGSVVIPLVPPVTVTGSAGTPSTTTVSYHWRAVDRVALGTCAAAYPGGAPAFPCGGAGAAGADAQVCFRLTSTAGGPWTSGRRDINPGAAAGNCGAAFAACATSYQIPAPPAYPTKDTLTITHTANVTLNGFVYFLRLQNAGLREMHLDNIEAFNPTALNAARVHLWRDCSGAADPATCL